MRNHTMRLIVCTGYENDSHSRPNECATIGIWNSRTLGYYIKILLSCSVNKTPSLTFIKNQKVYYKIVKNTILYHKCYIAMTMEK